MHLKKITLVNFKNFESQSFDFEDKINCFVGDNGVGKTNVLDAIYYLSFAKSYFNPIASQNIRHSEDFFMIEGEYEVNDRKDIVVCSLKRGGKKVIKRNGKSYEKFSEHIGYLPLVIISPADRDLIIDGSDTRRKFVDSVISQSDRKYLQTVIKYNKVLSQRNSLLKYFAANRSFDALNLKVYDEQLNKYGGLIFEKRMAFLDKFIPIFKKRYQAISNSKENVNLVYKTQIEDVNLLDYLSSTENVIEFCNTQVLEFIKMIYLLKLMVIL